MQSVWFYGARSGRWNAQGAQLPTAGLNLLGQATERNKLVHSKVRHAPDVLVCELLRPNAAFFKPTQAMAGTPQSALLV